MRKARHIKYFLQEDLSKRFRWITAIRPYKCVPGSTESYIGSFYKKLSDSEREDFEKFARDFFEVHPHGKHQVVCCWQESGFVLIVF